MRRNACIVLGNGGRARDLGVLETALADADPVVAGHAAWAVGSIGGGRARRMLERVEATEVRSDVLREIRDGLARMGDAGQD